MSRLPARWRVAAAICFGLGALVVTALPAAAGTDIQGHARSRRIAVGDITIATDEVVDGPLVAVDGRARVRGRIDGSAVVFRGDLTLEAGGQVDGDVVVVRGDAHIAGTVDGDVVVLGGRAVVSGTAVVDGDIRSTDSPQVASGADVGGDVDRIDILGTLTALGVGLLLVWWFAVTFSTALLGAILLAVIPRALDAAAAVGRDRQRWWVALLAGVGALVVLPLLAVATASSLIGLPIGVGIMGSLGMIHALGYVAGAYFLGRLILREPKNRFGAFFIGWGILRVFALIPLLGLLGWFIAATYGMGMLAVAAINAGRERPSSPMATAATPSSGQPVIRG